MNTPNDTTIQSTVSRDIQWAHQHHISLAIIAVLTLLGIFGVENLVAHRSHDQWEQFKALSADKDKQNAQFQAQNKAQIDALTAQNAQLAQQFSAAMAAMAARDSQLLKDRAEIKTLPPSVLATKWGAAAGEPAPVISQNGDFDAPLALAQKSTDALIQVPVLSKDISELQNTLNLSQQTAANNQKKFEDEQKAHQSDNAACTADKNTLNAKIKSVQDDARKNNFIFLAIGWIARTVIGSKI